MYKKWTLLATSSAILVVMPVAEQSARNRINAEQLKQLLTTAQTAHQSDEAVLKQLENVELSARLNTASQDEILAISPGARSSMALRALIDLSSFLDPEAGEIQDTPVPSADEQAKMLHQALHYVARTLPAMPNFLATRATGHFNDTPMTLSNGGQPVRGELHLVSKSASSITFRDGRESDGPTRAVSSDLTKAGQSALSLEDSSRSWVSTSVMPNHEAADLETHGEFGPILGIVLLDSAKGKTSWAHWEKNGDKQAAVFHFGVERAMSHYTVAYCCVDDKGAHLITGYHGSITLDPENGTILRITIQGDLRKDDPMIRSEMMVEYGPVKIGGSTYICPVRSVSVSAPNSNWNGLTPAGRGFQARLLLNDVQYIDYHRFGSDARLIAAPAAEDTPKP